MQPSGAAIISPGALWLWLASRRVFAGDPRGHGAIRLPLRFAAHLKTNRRYHNNRLLFPAPVSPHAVSMTMRVFFRARELVARWCFSTAVDAEGYRSKGCKWWWNLPWGRFLRNFFRTLWSMFKYCMLSTLAVGGRIAHRHLRLQALVCTCWCGEKMINQTKKQTKVLACSHPYRGWVQFHDYLYLWSVFLGSKSNPSTDYWSLNKKSSNYLFSYFVS